MSLLAAGSEYNMPNRDTTLYAFWNTSTTFYTVSYDANGATSGTTPTAQQIRSDSIVVLPLGTGLTRTGFTFGGWSTNSSGNWPTFSAGSSYTVTGDITFYAKWETEPLPPIYYTVTFHPNGGSGTVPPPQTVLAGSSITLPTGDGLYKNGSSFQGWEVKLDANVSGIWFAGTLYTPKSSITMYAYWGGGTSVSPPRDVDPPGPLE